MTQFIDVQLKAEDLHKHFSKILLKHLKNFWNYAKKNTLVSGNADDEKNLHPDQIYFFSQFSGDILFSSLVSFTFFVFCFFFFACLLVFCFFLLVCLFFAFFCLFVCFLKLKIYILIHTPLCGRVITKFSPSRFPELFTFFDYFFFGLICV